MPPYLLHRGDGFSMIEILFIAQLARRPLPAIVRHWWCRSIYCASRGQRRRRECTKS
jgi:hypothetical protein